MLGRNEFHFNHATMRQIVQHYFDTVLFNPAIINDNILEVTSLDYRGSPDKDFVVRVETVKHIEKDEEDPKVKC